MLDKTKNQVEWLFWTQQCSSLLAEAAEAGATNVLNQMVKGPLGVILILRHHLAFSMEDNLSGSPVNEDQADTSSNHDDNDELNNDTNDHWENDNTRATQPSPEEASKKRRRKFDLPFYKNPSPRYFENAEMSFYQP